MLPQLSELYSSQLLALAEPMPGMREWVASLAKYNVPCALVSALDRATVSKILQRIGLHDFFVHQVTDNDGMETVAQRLLSASMKLNRCVCVQGFSVGCVDGWAYSCAQVFSKNRKVQDAGGP